MKILRGETSDGQETGKLCPCDSRLSNSLSHREIYEMMLWPGISIGQVMETDGFAMISLMRFICWNINEYHESLNHGCLLIFILLMIEPSKASSQVVVHGTHV